MAAGAVSAASAAAAAASPLRVSVKWNSNEYKDLEVDVTESLMLFKTQLFTLTGVPPERQKLMVKGRLLKEMEDLQKAAATAAKGGGAAAAAGGGEALKIVMLGTAEGGELKQPAQKIVFLEDLTPAEQARLLREKNIEPLPSGITNLGNTCYLASVLQMLRPCHELTAAISKYIVSNASTAALASGSSGASHRLGLAIKDFYLHWENSPQAAQPLLLVHAIREAFPQFARKSAAGPAGLGGEAYMQQDAEECLVCLTSVLGDMLPKSRTAAAIAALPTSYSKAQNFIEALFGFDILVTSWREYQGGGQANTSNSNSNSISGSSSNSSSSGSNSSTDSMSGRDRSSIDASTAPSTTTATSTSGGATAARQVEKKLEKRIEFTCFLGTLQHPVNTLDEGMKFSLGEERIDLGPTVLPAAAAADSSSSSSFSSSSSSSSAAAGDAPGAAAGTPIVPSASMGSTTLVRTSLFASLPFYFIIHFMRFEWKRTGGQTEKAKVCKSLKFSSTLDVQPFCTDELKEQLRIGRAVMALRRDREAGDPNAGLTPAAKRPSSSSSSSSSSSNSSSGTSGTSSNTTSSSTSSTSNSSSNSSTVDSCSGKAAAVDQAAAQSSLPNGSSMEVEQEPQEKKQSDSSHEEGKNEKKEEGKSGNSSSNSSSLTVYPTGVFNLLGIVTHQGRHADSGHYVGWAKKDQREPRRIEREQRQRREQEAAAAAAAAAAAQAEEAEGGKKSKEGGESSSKGYIRPQRRPKVDDTWLKFDDDKVSEMPWSQIDLAGGRSDYHIAYLLLYRHCMVEPTDEELQTVERMHQEQLREAQILVEQKKRRAAAAAAATDASAAPVTTAKKN